MFAAPNDRQSCRARSAGVAGVPRATLVVLLATASTFRLPTEPIFLILGVDAFADMGRTAVNVIGNCLAAAVVARSEGELAASTEKVSFMDWWKSLRRERVSQQ